jgi:hypothetical protein
MCSRIWPAEKRRVSRRLGMGSGLWAAYVEQGSRSLGMCSRIWPAEKRRVSRRLGMGSGLWAAYVEQGEQKSRNVESDLAS